MGMLKIDVVIYFGLKKKDFASYLSQLELQKVIERTMRRSGIPLVFSKGYNPRPKISFGRALPVGVASLCECLGVQARKRLDEHIIDELNKNSIPGISFNTFEYLGYGLKIPQSIMELYELVFINNKENYLSELQGKSIKDLVFKKKDKKIPLDWVVDKWEIKGRSIYFMFDWKKCYLNPLSIIKTIFKGIYPMDFILKKIKQFFENEENNK